uniref:Uncharacterized protein n=1 Tax=Haptolina brevifila TaxID=156173 RepID=A0A7S2IJQ9_9EUKA
MQGLAENTLGLGEHVDGEALPTHSAAAATTPTATTPTLTTPPTAGAPPSAPSLHFETRSHSLHASEGRGVGMETVGVSGAASPSPGPPVVMGSPTLMQWVSDGALVPCPEVEARWLRWGLRAARAHDAEVLLALFLLPLVGGRRLLALAGWLMSMIRALIRNLRPLASWVAHGLLVVAAAVRQRWRTERRSATGAIAGVKEKIG